MCRFLLKAAMWIATFAFLVLLVAWWLTIIVVTQKQCRQLPLAWSREDLDDLILERLIEWAPSQESIQHPSWCQPCGVDQQRFFQQEQQLFRLEQEIQELMQQQELGMTSESVSVAHETGGALTQRSRLLKGGSKRRDGVRKSHPTNKKKKKRFGRQKLHQPGNPDRSLQHPSFVALQLDMQNEVSVLKTNLTLLEANVDQLIQQMHVQQQITNGLVSIGATVTNSTTDSKAQLQIQVLHRIEEVLKQPNKPPTPPVPLALEAQVGTLQSYVHFLMQEHADLSARITPVELCLSSITQPAQTNSSDVLASDTILVPPNSQVGANGSAVYPASHPLNDLQYKPIIAPIVGYDWTPGYIMAAHSDELPIYQTLNRNSHDYWNYLVDELLLSRVPMALLHGRGCYNSKRGNKGPGNMCPRTLKRFVKAIDAAGARGVIQFGMFVATGATPLLAGVQQLDLSKKKNWNYFWAYNIKIWFDTIPQDMWYLLDGKPIIACWTLSYAFFTNQQGNASRMLTWIIKKFKQRYGVKPFFILQDTWFETDSTITTKQAKGRHGWFAPVYNVTDSVFSFRTYNGATWGVTTPAYQNGYSLPNCGATCREVPRDNGTTLTNALTLATTTENASWMMLEGWTDIVESAGFYRSDAWAYPTQYINIVRQFANPEPETIRFEAEGVDAFYDTTPENLGMQYANRSIDVGALANNTGWYVGWTVAGEWFEYQNVQLGCGTYRFTARVATKSGGKQIRLDLGNLSSVVLPYSGGLDNFILVHLGEVRLKGGSYDLRLVMESTGGLSIDWFFLKRSEPCYCQLDTAVF